MADETVVGGPNETVTPPAPDPAAEAAKTAEARKAARKGLLERFEAENKRSVPSTPEPKGEAVGDGLDLTGVDDATARKIRAEIQKANDKNEYVSTLAKYGLEQAATAEALRIAREFKLDDDEIPAIEKALGTARTPDDVNLAARELRIKLKEDGTVAVEPAKTEPAPKIDTGRGGGTNKTAALDAKLDEIDPYGDPVENEKKLEALRPEAEAAQRRYNERIASTMR